MKRFVILVGVLSLLFTSPAAAQDDVTGSADYRNPPQLTDGLYRDTIVTGEAVWYAVLYRNNDDLDVTVDLADVDLESQDELTLSAQLIGPTLSGAGSRGLNVGGQWSYNGGEINLWYVEVSLETTGRLGVEHDLVIGVSGTLDLDLGICDPSDGCTLIDDIAAVDAEIVTAQAQIDDLGSRETSEIVAGEIAAAEAQAASVRQEDGSNEAAIAELCDPDATCTEVPITSSTPTGLLVLGVLAIAGGLGFLGWRFSRRNS